MPERRQITRWQIGRQAKVKLEGAEAFTNCSIQDLNFKGMQVSLPLKLPKDTFIRMGLALSETFTLNLEAWVAWQKTVDGHHIYGLYFSKIRDADKEKIYQFMRQDYSQQLAQKWWQGVEEGGETMNNAKFADRRVFQRFPARFSVRYFNTSANREGVAQTCDIGAKGLGLVVTEELPVSASLELWLEIPDQGEPFYSRGQVAWSKCSGLPGECRAGINLEKADLMGLSRALRVM